jgi:hypothetical protein
LLRNHPPGRVSGTSLFEVLATGRRNLEKLLQNRYPRIAVPERFWQVS